MALLASAPSDAAGWRRAEGFRGSSKDDVAMLLDQISTELWLQHRQAWNDDLARACGRLIESLGRKRSRPHRMSSAAAALLLSGASVGTAILPGWPA